MNRREFFKKTCGALAVAAVVPQTFEDAYARSFSIGTSAAPDYVLEGTYGGFLVPSDAGESFQRNQVWIKATMEMDVAIRHTDSFVLISEGE